MIFSRPVITAMAENNAFTCSHSTQPDDMEVGSNLNRIDIPLTHSPYFHQVCIFFIYRYSLYVLWVNEWLLFNANSAMFQP
jgi:hypothetical protein